MIDTVLLAAAVALLVAVLALLAALLRRGAAAVDLAPLLAKLAAAERAQERAERALRDEMGRSREEGAAAARGLRGEVAASLKGFSDSVGRYLAQVAQWQKGQMDTMAQQVAALSAGTDQRMEQLRATVEERLERIREGNERHLEEMRRTVDEKLQGTLEARLGESFRLVTAQLEQVHRGLGEMQTLAAGVGDLKRVLQNVKVRGGWGEVQLGSLLEQCLHRDQYDVNVATREGSDERVEFAIRLPGRGEADAPVWLPIDAKFPLEDYTRLVDAHDRADPEAADAAARQLEARIRLSAREVSEKYLHPPRTTDFAILFLPTEGLYAEVVRRPGLVDALQRDSRVLVAGPTTLWALLSSLQMGFRTLAIQKRSGEVWAVLGAVKSEFGKFGDVIAKVQKKLQEASNQVDTVGVRTRAIQRRLRGVEQLSDGEGERVLVGPGADVFPPAALDAALPALPDGHDAAAD
jgi:DNA recombination protein RmuC